MDNGTQTTAREGHSLYRQQNSMPLAVDSKNDFDPLPLSEKALPIVQYLILRMMTSRAYNNLPASLLVNSLPVSLWHWSIQSGFSTGAMSPSIYRSNGSTLVLSAALKFHEATIYKCIHISNRCWILNTISWLQRGWKLKEGDFMHFKHLRLELISYSKHVLLFH